MSKILVIGGTGFVGKHLAPRLKNLKPSYLVRSSSNIDHLQGEKLIFGDITNYKDLIDALKGQEIIINLATPNTQNEQVNQDIIVRGTENLLRAAEKNNAKKIIHLSSAAASRKNLDSYGKAKLEADILLKEANIPTIILKPTMIFGRGGYAFEKLLKSLTAAPGVAPIIGSGQNKIQPVYVKDVAQAIINSINYTPKETTETFDLAGQEPIKFRDFAKKILSALHKKKLIVPIPLSLVSTLAAIAHFFIKSLPFNKTTIKRMVEELSFDTEPAQKKLKLKFTSYDSALKEVFSSQSK